MTADTDGEASPKTPWWKGAKGEWYVVVQVVIFCLIVFGPRSGPGLPAWATTYIPVLYAIGVLLMLTGAILAVWGVRALGSNLTALPYPKDGASLVETGPYRFVRNPIYSGLIIGSFGIALVAHSWLSVGYALALLVLFDLKTRREERWLCERYPAYAAYQQRVRKLLPWVW